MYTLLRFGQTLMKQQQQEEKRQNYGEDNPQNFDHFQMHRVNISIENTVPIKERRKKKKLPRYTEEQAQLEKPVERKSSSYSIFEKMLRSSKVAPFSLEVNYEKIQSEVGSRNGESENEEKKNEMKRTLDSKEMKIQKNEENDDYQSQDQINPDRIPSLMQVRENQKPDNECEKMWIFFLQSQIPDFYRQKICELYSRHRRRAEYIVPLCYNKNQVKSCLDNDDYLFTIVFDSLTAKDALRFKKNDKIIQYYVFNDQNDPEIIKIKEQSEKIKNPITNNLSQIIDIAKKEYPQNQEQNKLRELVCPSFLRLSGYDKSAATLYRINLYGAKKLQSEERNDTLKDFINLVQQKYGSANQKENIQKYKEMDHDVGNLNDEKAKKIIQFYITEGFYYRILNAMLRTTKSINQFSPCILPFNQTYFAIKHFYEKRLNQNKRKIKAQTVYRGVPFLRSDEFKMLKRLKDEKQNNKEIYIEMFGFISTSQNKKMAKKFGKILYVIQIPEIQIPQSYSSMDHGFIDIDKEGIYFQKGDYQRQKEILFNAMNIFKVKQVKQPQDFSCQLEIHLEYGAIFKLQQDKKYYKRDLSVEENDILINYEYCLNMQRDIEDQGDAYLLSNEFKKARKYYNNKILPLKNLQDQESNKKLIKYYFKLGKVCKEEGKLEWADKYIRKALERQAKETDRKNKHHCLLVYAIHSKHAQVNFQIEDFSEATESLDKAINIVPENNDFKMAIKLRERGQINFKKGEISQAEEDFSKSENLLQNLMKNFEEFVENVESANFKRKVKHFFGCCFYSQQQKQREVDEYEKKIKQLNSARSQLQGLKEKIRSEKIKLQNSIREVLAFVEDTKGYEKCLKKAQTLFQEIKSQTKTNDPYEIAKLKALEAEVSENGSQSVYLLTEAIQSIEKADSKDKMVGQYSYILAKKQKQKLQSSLCTQEATQNISQYQSLVRKCRSNYKKAIKNKTQNYQEDDSREIMSFRNELSEMQFNASSFDSSERVVLEVAGLNEEKGKEHSQIARSFLLLSRIANCRGDMKDSFEKLKTSEEILRKSLIKKDQEKYRLVFQQSETYIKIKMHRAKLYLRQVKHDMCLLQVNQISSLLEKKLQGIQEHTLIADVQELKGQYKAQSKNPKGFSTHYQKAIRIREKQKGFYNSQNALAYCYLSDYYSIYRSYQPAYECLDKAVKIFSYLPANHPKLWKIYYSIGQFKSKKGQMKEGLKKIQLALQLTSKNFDKTHNTVNKIRFKYAKNLQKAGQKDESMKQFSKLWKSINKSLLKTNKKDDDEQDERCQMKKSITSEFEKYREDQSLRESSYFYEFSKLVTQESIEENN